MNLIPILDLARFNPTVVSGWEQGQKSVLVPVARCDETTCRVMYRCHLFQADDVVKGCWEFTFDMYAEWLDDSEQSFKTMDRNIAKEYIPEVVQPCILPAVFECIDILIQEVNPVSIYRVTKGAGLPEKALKKHHMLTKRFVGLGYTHIEDGLDQAGRCYWLMTR